MLTRISSLAVTRPRTVLIVALAFALLCGIGGASVVGHLKGGGFTPPDAESTLAAEYLDGHFVGAEPNYVLLVTTPDGVDAPDARAAGEQIVTLMRGTAGVDAVQSYWTVPAPFSTGLRSNDGTSALVTAHVDGDDTSSPDAAADLTERLEATVTGVVLHAGGPTMAYHDIDSQITSDLAKAELVAIPISAVVLVLVFGSVVAALLPLAVGVFAILASLAILRSLTLVTDVSIYALNLTTALGLALAIDYSLFMVSRFREELGNGLDTEAAVIRTVQTAGRTVLFSALVVGLSLAALLVFPVYFLESFAYSGLATIATAALAAILVLPACLILLGDRVNSWDLRAPLRRLFRRPPPAPVPPERSWWYRMVGGVTRHAILVAVAVTALLLTLGAPFLSAAFAYPDDRVITTAAPSRVVGDALREDFPVDVSTPVEVVLPDYSAGGAALGDYAAQLSRTPDVASVLSAVGTYAGGQQVGPGIPDMANDAGVYLTVAGGADPFSAEGTALLQSLRSVPAPVPALFGGASAANTDALDSLSSRLPLALTLIAVSTLVVLFLFTGSVVLPVKAIVLNTLSLSATFGAMVWVFQEGHFSGLLGFTATDYLVPTMPILMFCLAFGMSMDYEVFLLSRVREEWLAGPCTNTANTHAVAMGVARTGRIFTAAAALMAIVFIAMTTSQVSFIKMFGLGLTITVLTDATLIRCCLAPALMHLMGRANWWAPRPLVRLHARIGFTEDSATLPKWSPSTSRTPATPPGSSPPN